MELAVLLRRKEGNLETPEANSCDLAEMPESILSRLLVRCGAPLSAPPPPPPVPSVPPPPRRRRRVCCSAAHGVCLLAALRR